MWEPSAVATAVTLHSLAPGRGEIPLVSESHTGLLDLCLCTKQNLSSLAEQILCRCPWGKIWDLCKTSCQRNLNCIQFSICDNAGRSRYMCKSMSEGQAGPNPSEKPEAWIMLPCMLHIRTFNTTLHLKLSGRLDLSTRLRAAETRHGERSWPLWLRLRLAQSSVRFCLIRSLRAAAVWLPVPVADGKANTVSTNDQEAALCGND